MAYSGAVLTAEPSKAAVAGQQQARAMIKIIASVICLALMFAIVGRYTGIGADRVVNGSAVATHLVTIIVQPDESVVLASYDTKQIVAKFDAGHGGFLRGALRAFGLKRNQMKIDSATPYTVTRWESGRVSLVDSKTGQFIPVDSFGPYVQKMFEPLVAAQ